MRLTNVARNAVIIGPADTPFEDGTFRLVMHFEEQYPNKPPSVKFISQMFHPNVYATGELCLDILQNRWSPTYDVAAVLTSIQRSVETRTCTEVVTSIDDVSRLACSTTRTPAPLLMLRRLTYTRTTARNIQREYERRLRRVGKIDGLGWTWELVKNPQKSWVTHVLGQGHVSPRRARRWQQIPSTLGRLCGNRRRSWPFRDG